VEQFEYVQTKLHKLHLVAPRIKATLSSKFDTWRVEIEKRLRSYLNEVVAVRTGHHSSGTSLMEQGTFTHASKDLQTAIHLNYLYEAIQQERQIPLLCYDHFPASLKAFTPPDSVQGEDRATYRA
jgi:hypothetical protein